MTFRRSFLVLLVVVASALSGLTAAIVSRQLTAPSRQTWTPGPSEPSASSDPFDLLPSLSEPMNLLIMGTDLELVKHGKVYTPTLNGRTDTVLLVHIRPNERRVYAVSIPRDTRVMIPKVGLDKINAANVYGGARLVEQTVANFINVPIDRYIRLNTAGVIQLIDALGGVTLYVPQHMHYNDFSQHLYINFNQGWHHLNGQQAQGYIRFRHDNLADIGRIQRQQQFIHAMMDQAFRPATLLKVPQLLKIAHDNLETDLSTIEIFRLMRWARGLTRKDLNMVMLPGDFSPGNGTYWLGNPARIAGFLSHYRYNDPVGSPEASPSVEFRADRYAVAVRDGVGNRKQAKLLVTFLREQGYRAYYGGNITGMGYAWPVATTQVIAQKGEPEIAATLQQQLGMGDVISSSTGDLLSDFTVVMGQDWVQLQKQQALTLKPMNAPAMRAHRGGVGQ